ncbi:MAG TPA: cell envelope integrity EipB family protein [Xanthobacteraceae bacterium]|nr:cell envelope integrity EipB family protein [Xanthobacteraceae bacterium]
MTRFKLMPAALAAGLLSLPVMPAHAERIPLAAHRAIYELALDPTKASTRVDTARGRIAFEMSGNPCDGYSVSLRQVTELDTGEGKATMSDLRSTTWEGGDAKTFRFKNQNYVNRELRDDVDGTADKSDDGGLMVKLAKPKSPSLKLGGPILLPTEQLAKIIEIGEAGDHLLKAKVYDGSPDGKKVYDTLSVIGGPVTGEGKDLEEAARAEALASLKRFPVTVSYFEPSDETGEQMPAYTLTFELYENGVSRALKLDYGNFALKGDLKSVEFLKAAPCKK